MQHYQRNTTGILKHCSTCNRLTMHRVDDRRVGNCREVHVVGMSQAQKKATQTDNHQLYLFKETP